MNFKKATVLLAVLGVSLASVHGQTTKKKTVAKKTTTTQTSKKATTTVVSLKNAQDSLSYALGMDIARSLKSSGLNVNLAQVSKGLAAQYTGGKTLFSEAQIGEIIQQNMKITMEKPGKDFLTSLKKKPTIKTTPEGLYYEVIVQGTGKQPLPTDEVKVHYAGYLIDGKKFDSSYDRGEPINLKLNQVIEGWKIGVPLMNIGSKYKLYIPYELGYGERGSGANIPPYSTLIFDLELLDIVAPNAVQ